MQQTCQQCQQPFAIDAVDQAFYQGIAVPPPTFCWRCRMQRRFAFRNERKLYPSTCAKTGKPIITIFDPANGYVVYDRDTWWRDDWSALEFGQHYDFVKPFFSQWQALFKRVPQPAVFNSKCTDSAYCNHVGELNKCYLVFASWEGENLYYATRESNCKDSFDLSGSTTTELGYETIGGNTLYNVQFVQNCTQVRDSQFLYECRNVHDCFGCVNLRNKSFCFFNEQLDETTYRQRLADIDLGGYQNVLNVIQKFTALKQSAIHRFTNATNAPRSTGNNLLNTENCDYCFDARGVNDCRYCVNAVGPMSDTYDGYGVGAEAELMYELIDSGIHGSMLLFDAVVWGGHNVLYSYNCTNCKDCFGCIGLRNVQYCILNQQYTKEEYEQLLPKVIAHMNTQPYVDQVGRVYKYGEFFPVELSPFPYNETVAQEHFTLTRTEIEQQGWIYKTETKADKHFTLTATQLPDHIKDTAETITKDVIQCAHAGDCAEQCTVVYKIMPAEYAYLKQRSIALPRLCPNCRHFARLSQENPFNLWKRNCAKCQLVLMTPYAPDRPEVIYCEECYLAEVG